MLHACSSLDSPTQSLPPYLGTGAVHSLDRECLPAPQVTGRVDQPVQLLQFPSTETEMLYVVYITKP